MKTIRRSVAEAPPKVSKGGPKDPPDWDKWVGHRTLRRDLNLGSGTVYELLKEAGISAHEGADGSKKYPPDTIDKLRPLLLDSDQEAAPVGADLVKSAAALVKSSEERVKNSEDSTRQLIEVMVKPLQLALSTLEKINEQQSARLELLEGGRDAAVKAREDLLSEVAARDIATREHAAQEERKTQAWGLLLNRAPALLDQVQHSLIGKGAEKNPAVREQISAVISLLTSLEPQKVQALRESGFLSKEQLTHVDKILELSKAEPKTGGNSAPSNGKTG